MCLLTAWAGSFEIEQAEFFFISSSCFSIHTIVKHRCTRRENFKQRYVSAGNVRGKSAYIFLQDLRWLLCFLFLQSFQSGSSRWKILVHRPNIKHRELRYYLFFSFDNFSLIAFFLNQGNHTELWHKNKLLK